MKIKSNLKLGGLIALVTLTLGCGSTPNGGSATGTLSLGLTDSPTDLYSAVYVTLREIQVHSTGESPESESGWITLATPNKTYNLLELRDGIVEGLGEGPLPAGGYTQMRLRIGPTPDDSPNILCQSHPFANYVIDADDDEIHELKVPSGEQTGIKIVNNFEIAPNQTTELIIDFDANKSVVKAGNSGNYNLKPTIKVLSTQNFTLLQGQVREFVEPPPTDLPIIPLSEAGVSAQIFDPLAPDLKDQVIVQASTQSDGNGDYQLFLRPGSYNLVAYLEGHHPETVGLNALAGETPVQDFELQTADLGSLSGNLDITAADPDTFAFFSVRQEINQNGVEIIEVLSFHRKNGQNFSVNLPEGDYQVVSSTCNQTTQEAEVLIEAGNDTLLDIVF